MALTARALASETERPRGWQETLSPHFRVVHQAAFLPPGMLLGLEKSHNRLRLDMAMFSPWMARERVHLFLFANRESYLKSRFKPPAWSNGIAFYEPRLLAVYDQRSRKKLMEVITHEMAHLLFEGYWGEAHKSPPAWLNEGLAMLEESGALAPGDEGQWHQAMTELPGQPLIPLKTLVAISPDTDLKDQQAVSLWYVESYSLVNFLYRRHSRLQFFRFCQRLREGAALRNALWEAYRYSDLGRLEAAWLEWLGRPGGASRAAVASRRAGRDAGEEPASGPGAWSAGPSYWKKMEFRHLDFHGLRQAPKPPAQAAQAAPPGDGG